jgi:ketosteroid isomerase-like protein
MGKREATLSSRSNASGRRAMSQENVEVVRRGFELLAEGLRRGDPGYTFDACVREGIVTPDIAVNAGVRGGVGVAGIDDVVGRDGWIEFMGSWSEDFEEFTIEAEEIIDAGDDRVVVISRNRGTGRASGAPVGAHFGAVYTLKAGRVTRGDFFVKPSHALRAAGLSE